MCHQCHLCSHLSEQAHACPLWVVTPLSCCCADVLKFFGCELGAQTKYDKTSGTCIVNGAASDPAANPCRVWLTILNQLSNRPLVLPNLLLMYRCVFGFRGARGQQAERAAGVVHQEVCAVPPVWQPGNAHPHQEGDDLPQVQGMHIS
jgi:hypothetical protein